MGTIHRNLRGLTFRSCSSEDLETCSKLAEDAWPMSPRLGQRALAPREMQAWVHLSLLWSDWAELACESQEVVGLLFGKIFKHKKDRPTASWVFTNLMLFARFILGRYGGPPRNLRFLWNFLLTETKVAINQPRADAEIVLLIVHSSRQKEGIGKVLLDRFISAARQGAQITVRVYSGGLSNEWRFYERYGFKRVGIFYDNLASYFASRYTNGFFYLLTL